jgi:hypothetical protein
MFVGSNTFSHGTLRKYVIYFGTLFNNLWLTRYDANGTQIQNMKVPLNYGPREKFLARLDGNPDLNRQIATQLPRMSFEMSGMAYDSTRKLPALNKMTGPSQEHPEGRRYQYQPVPYNIQFTLSIMTKNVEDGTFIVEQILPYFTPTWTATLNLNTELDQKYDIPITLDSITHDDTYEGDFINRRAIIWTLTFTMKAYFFGPTITALSGIIKNIDLNFISVPTATRIEIANSTNTDAIASVNIRPGMYANGQATSQSTHLYQYRLSNLSGNFNVLEKVYVNGNNYAYLATSNSTVVSARRIVGDIKVNDVITGANSRASATVSNVSIIPALSVPVANIYSTNNYGIIVNFIDDL